MKNKPSFKIDECPERTLHSWFEAQTDIAERFSGLKPSLKPSPFIRFKIKDFNTEEVLQSVIDANTKYGWFGFLSHFKDTPNRTPYYGGFSITYNPEIAYPVPEHASALGEPKVNLHDFFETDAGRKAWFEIEDKKIGPQFFKICFQEGLKPIKQFLEDNGIEFNDPTFDWDKKFVATKKSLRNGYFDTYGFRFLTDAAKEGALGKFLTNRVKRRLCRSRTAYINGLTWNPKAKDFMWHTDEPIYINQRINIPLQTTSNYVCEVKDQGIHKFEVGYAYTWDTTAVHRVYSLKRELSQRIHLVLGTIPWFDYDPESRTYYANEFYGEMHPYDMVANGHVIEGVEVDKDSVIYE